MNFEKQPTSPESTQPDLVVAERVENIMQHGLPTSEEAAAQGVDDVWGKIAQFTADAENAPAGTYWHERLSNGGRLDRVVKIANSLHAGESVEVILKAAAEQKDPKVVDSLQTFCSIVRNSLDTQDAAKLGKPQSWEKFSDAEKTFWVLTGIIKDRSENIAIEQGLYDEENTLSCVRDFEESLQNPIIPKSHRKLLRQWVDEIRDAYNTTPSVETEGSMNDSGGAEKVESAPEIGPWKFVPANEPNIELADELDEYLNRPISMENFSGIYEVLENLKQRNDKENLSEYDQQKVGSYLRRYNKNDLKVHDVLTRLQNRSFRDVLQQAAKDRDLEALGSLYVIGVAYRESLGLGPDGYDRKAGLLGDTMRMLAGGKIIRLAGEKNLLKRAKGDPEFFQWQIDDFKAYAESKDLPENIQRYARELQDRLTDIAERAAQKTAVMETPLETNASEAKTESPVSPSVENNAEKGFVVKEKFTKEDLAGIRGEIEELRQDRNYVEYARRLTELKQANVNLSEAGKEKLRSELMEYRKKLAEAKNGEALALYLADLKKLGFIGITDVNEQEEKLVQSAINERVSNGNFEGISWVCERAMYLAIPMDVAEMEKMIKKELENVQSNYKISDTEKSQQLALILGRVRTINHLQDKINKFEAIKEDDPLEKLAIYNNKLKLDDYPEWSIFIYNGSSDARQDKNWEAYVRLCNYRIDKYGREGIVINKETQEQLENHVDVLRQQARKNKKWRSFTSYLGYLFGLSKSKEAVELSEAGS